MIPPIEPTYIPYSALTTQYVPNMLIPGYAVNASSFAWSEMRVFPNLCVLGDAAGIAAVTCLLSGDSAYGLKDISGVREILKRYNAIIDKKRYIIFILNFIKAVLYEPLLYQLFYFI